MVKTMVSCRFSPTNQSIDNVDIRNDRNFIEIMRFDQQNIGGG